MSEGIGQLKGEIMDRATKRACKRFRKEMGLWGFNLDNMTDEEIIERIEGMNDVIRETKFSMKEATAGFCRLAKLLN